MVTNSPQKGDDHQEDTIEGYEEQSETIDNRTWVTRGKAPVKAISNKKRSI